MAQKQSGRFRTEEELKREAREKRAEEIRLQQLNPKTESAKKRENFWYHHKWHTVIAAIAVLLSIFFISDTFFRQKPDFTITMVTKEYIPPESADRLASAVEAAVSELNGGKKISIAIDSISLPDENAEIENPYGMAGIMKLHAIIAAGSDPIFLLDNKALEFLNGMDGTTSLFAEDIGPVDAEKFGGEEFSGIKLYIRNYSDSDEYYEYCKDLLINLYRS